MSLVAAHVIQRRAMDLSDLGSNPNGSFFLLYFTLPLKITQALSCEVPRNSVGFSSSDLQIH